MGHLVRELEVQQFLRDAVRVQIGSGSAASFGNLEDLIQGKPGIEIYVGKTGWVKDARLISPATLFDLASLTKIVATTTLAMVQYEAETLKLDSKLSELRPERVKANPSLANITVSQLLSHTSGLPAWKPFYLELQKKFSKNLTSTDISIRKNAGLELVYAVQREHEPGSKVLYSDIGMLILEDLLSKDFEKEVSEIWARIPGCGLHFRHVTESAWSARQEIAVRNESVAMTEACPERGLLQGQVHDDNTWSFGGVAGHAGVFGTLNDLLLWLKALFSGEIVQNSTLRIFFKEADTPVNARRALGFDLTSLDGTGSTGFSFSPNSVGHLGYSGTSLWVDLDSGDYAILLTNRVHPTRNDIRIRALRQEFHRLVRGR